MGSFLCVCVFVSECTRLHVVGGACMCVVVGGSARVGLIGVCMECLDDSMRRSMFMRV